MKKILSLFLATFCCVAMSMAVTRAKAVFTPSDSTVVFFYDDLAHNGGDSIQLTYYTNGHVMLPYSHSDKVTTVKFDPSFYQYRPTDLSWTFQMYKKLRTIQGMEYLRTEDVTTMYGMFEFCQSLQSIDLSHLNTTRVTTMRNMFFNDTTLTSLDLSSFNTLKVTNMMAMFRGCYHLESLDLSNFVTDSVTTMQSMFSECRSLTSLDLSNFRGTKLTETNSMFYRCTSLEMVNLLGMQTDKVTTMDYMFYSNSKLKYIFADFDTTSLTTSNQMLGGCVLLPNYIKTNVSAAAANYEEGGYLSVPLFTNAHNHTRLNAVLNKSVNIALPDKVLRKDGHFNVITLPFSLSEQEIAAGPLAGATIKELSNITKDGNDITISTALVSSIEAGKIYFIKWSDGEDITDMMFAGVTPTLSFGNAESYVSIGVAMVNDLDASSMVSLNSSRYYRLAENDAWEQFTSSEQHQHLGAHLTVNVEGDYNVHFNNNLSVTFDAQGLFANPSAQYVGAGEHVTRPTLSLGNTDKVLYWSTDQAGTQHFDFENDVINSDITLYAQLADFSLTSLAFDGNSVKWDYAAAMAPEINTVSAELLMANDLQIALEPTIALADKQLDLTGYIFSGVGYRFAISMNDYYGNVVRDTTAAYTVAGEYTVLPLENLAVDANAHLTWTAPVPGLGKRKVAMYKYSVNEQVWLKVAGDNELIGMDKGVVAPADYNFNRSLADGDYRFEVGIYQGSVLIAEGTVFSGSAHDTYYRIRFLDWDNSVLEIDSVEAGYKPVYAGAEPTRDDDDDYSYAFKEWSPALTEATADADYVATYTATPHPRYQIRFLNNDGSVLQLDSLKAGEMPEYRGETPTKESDEQFDYVFTGWDKEIVVVTGPADYQAEFEAKDKPIDTNLRSATEAEPAEKILMNGTLYIIRAGRIYDAQGRLVE